MLQRIRDGSKCYKGGILLKASNVIRQKGKNTKLHYQSEFDSMTLQSELFPGLIPLCRTNLPLQSVIISFCLQVSVLQSNHLLNGNDWQKCHIVLLVTFPLTQSLLHICHNHYGPLCMHQHVLRTVQSQIESTGIQLMMRLKCSCPWQIV